MKKSNKPTIKKIPLEGLLTILHNLYEKGADYIDIYGEENSITKDTLHIYVHPDYYSRDYTVEEFEDENVEDCTITLNDDNINDLI